MAFCNSSSAISGLVTTLIIALVTGIDIAIFLVVILPFANYLNLPQQNIYAVEIDWDNEGNFIGLNNSNGFADSKIKGAKRIRSKFSDSSVIIGDGFTDYQLYQSSIVSDFIAYTGNIKRQKIIKYAPHIAESINDLLKLFALPPLSE